MSQSCCPQPMEECKPSPPAATILTSTKPFNPSDLVVAPANRADTPWTVPTLDNSRLSDDEPWQPKESPNQPLIDSFLGWMSPVPFVMPQQPEVHHPQLCKCADYKPKERRIGKTHQTHFLTFLYHLHLHTPKLGVANVPPPITVVLTSTSWTSHQLAHGDLKDGANIKTLLAIKGSLDIDTANRNQCFRRLTYNDRCTINNPSFAGPSVPASSRYQEVHAETMAIEYFERIL